MSRSSRRGQQEAAAAPPTGAAGSTGSALDGALATREPRARHQCRPELSGGSHRAVAGLPEAERDEWLTRAFESGWTSERLIRELKDRDRPPVEMVAPDDLKPHPRNYRSHPEDQLEHIRQSIREHGIYGQIVAAKDGTILAGHGLWQAANEEDVAEVPVVRMDYAPDDPKAIKLLTGDNDIGLGADDERRLADLLKESATDLAGTGYDAQQLAALALTTRPESELGDFDAAAEWSGAGMPGYKPLPKP